MRGSNRLTLSRLNRAINPLATASGSVPESLTKATYQSHVVAKYLYKQPTN